MSINSISGFGFTAPSGWAIWRPITQAGTAMYPALRPPKLPVPTMVPLRLMPRAEWRVQPLLGNWSVRES